jgi:hypothetical protein
MQLSLLRYLQKSMSICGGVRVGSTGVRWIHNNKWIDARVALAILESLLRDVIYYGGIRYQRPPVRMEPFWIRLTRVPSMLLTYLSTDSIP